MSGHDWVGSQGDAAPDGHQMLPTGHKSDYVLDGSPEAVALIRQDAVTEGDVAALANQFRAAAERCCQCTDGHHDWTTEHPYGTDDDVRMTPDGARRVAALLDALEAAREESAGLRERVREVEGERDAFGAILDENDELRGRLGAVAALADEWIAADGEPATSHDLTALTVTNRCGAQLRAAHEAWFPALMA